MDHCLPLRIPAHRSACTHCGMPTDMPAPMSTHMSAHMNAMSQFLSMHMPIHMFIHMPTHMGVPLQRTPCEIWWLSGCHAHTHTRTHRHRHKHTQRNMRTEDKRKTLPFECCHKRNGCSKRHRCTQHRNHHCNSQLQRLLQ